MRPRLVHSRDRSESREDGYLHDFSLSAFLQIACMEHSSCDLFIKNIHTDESATLYIKDGILLDVEYEDRSGIDAAISVLSWRHVNIILKQPSQGRERNIQEGVNLLLFEAARHEDEANRRTGTEGRIATPQKIEIKQDIPPTTPKSVIPSGIRKAKKKRTIQPIHLESSAPEIVKAKKVRKVEYDVEKVKAILNSFTDISGFIAVGIFSPDGEMIEEISKPGYDLASIGAIANELLIKAQSSTEMMDLGRGNLVHITAPKAHIFVRCLNESSHFQDTEFGKAHIHMALVISDKGNQPMAKMKLSKGIGGLAPHFR